jgi:hypothetical protein
MTPLKKRWRRLEKRVPGLYVNPDICHGRYQIYRIDEATGHWDFLFSKENLVLYTWGYLACQCIGRGNPAYAVAAAYLEYMNVVTAGTVVTPPTYDRSAGLSYFSGLPVNKDYLRVPLVGLPTIDIAPGYEPYFVSGSTGNRATFVAQSTGTVGVNGQPYSAAALSTVYGVTLVATPVQNTPADDIILSRGYFNTNDQQLKQDGSQIGVRWKISFQ